MAKKKLWNKKTKLVIIGREDVGVATYTPIFITPLPKSEWPKGTDRTERLQSFRDFLNSQNSEGGK